MTGRGFVVGCPGDEGCVDDLEYAGYPGGDKFEPWQDHEWPVHCDVPARYLGEIGERELRELAGGPIQSFLSEHDVDAQDGVGITIDMVPPHAPPSGEAWDTTVHHFRCTRCGWDLLLWDAN